VRAYAVLLAVLLTALSGYFEWLGARPGCAAPGARALFAGALSLALVTHYSSFFVLGATVLTPALLYVCHPRGASD